MTYRADPGQILARITGILRVVGFADLSIMAPDFGRVTQLRGAGVTTHFTVGGHYASFEPAELLERIPGLDSVVRFGGEMTLVNLLHCLAANTDWRSLPGIAFRQPDDEVTVAPLARTVEDLDTLPWPDRASINYEGHPMPTASVLGSRGCPWDCSFCSIRPFYEDQGGPLRRLRSPRAIVDEMLDLHRHRGVPIFLFQDDDFLAGGKKAKDWAVEIADLIVASGHAGEIAFKISCRSDEIREDVIERLMAGGLTHVYMGVESGDDEGLLNMSKRIKPETHLRAGRILEQFIGDGWTVAPFCRMLPYAGTPIKRRLESEGRLLGTQFEPDYRFLDPKLDLFYAWMVQTFYERNFTNQGLCHILRGLHFEAHLRLGRRNRVSDAQRAYLHHLTAVCNRVACYALRCAADHFEATPLTDLEQDSGYLQRLTEHEKNEERRLLAEVGQYYEWVHEDHSPIPGPVGGFEKSWTFHDGDREAAGVGAA
jgi:hypothetical protein